MKAFNFSTLRQYQFAVWMKPVFKLFTILAFRLKVRGKENIPAEGGFIVASNHVSGVDPMFVYTNLKIPVHYMSKQELFKSTASNWFYSHLNGFPVIRGRADKRAVEYAIDVVGAGHALGIFPEGTRSKNSGFLPAKAGVALVAKKTKAQILPVSVYAQGKIKPFAKITVRFGKPIPCGTLGFKTAQANAAELKAAAEYVMEQIKALHALGHAV